MAMSEEERKNLLRWLEPQPWELKAERENQLWEALLQARGLSDPAVADLFFQPEQIEFNDPFLFRDMQAACDLVTELIESGRTDFLIFGDYDADGFCATAILQRYFTAIGLEPRVLIPERLTEGYDLNLEQVTTILEESPDLLITVDCGTNAGEAVAALLRAGVSVIVSDHHQAQDLPDRSLCPYINPVLEDESYPFPYLSGAGVALKLALALAQYYPCDLRTIDTLYTLAAVATVADIMPLQDENRHLVWRGVQVFGEAAPVGLQLMVQEREVDSQAFAYQVGPRLNAAGRMGEVDVALELLLTDNPQRAQLLLVQLEGLNNQRKSIEEKIFQEARQQIEAEYREKKPALIIVAGDEWHLGVLGIVASRLVQQYRCPAIVLSREGDILKGSARSYGRFNLLASLEYTSDKLLQFGGHNQACGLQLETDKLADLRQTLRAYVAQNPKDLKAQPLVADCIMEIDEVNLDIIEELKKFEPSGQGNPAPRFMFPNLCVENISAVGQDKHLRLSVSSNYSPERRWNMIGFNLAGELPYYKVGDSIDVLGIPEINEYMGVRRTQVRIVAIRPADEEDINATAIREWMSFLNLRENGGCIESQARSAHVFPEIFPLLWQVLEAIGGEDEEGFIFNPTRLARLIREEYNVRSSELSLLLALSILEEAGLVKLMLEEDATTLLISKGIPEESKPRLRETGTWLLLEQCGGLRE